MKKTLSIIAVALALYLLTAPAGAANTVTSNNGSVEISAIDSDWSWSDTFSNVSSGMRLISIRFNPGAADDRCIVKNGSDTATVLFDSGKCTDEYDARIEYYFRAIRRPVLDFNVGTYSAGSKVTLEFDY